MKKEKVRCSWCLSSPLMMTYHDEEWGVPVHDDALHFEYIVLDSFQAGLSWSTILNKRENFRKAFDGFNAVRISRYTEKKIDKLLKDEGIIRNRLKVTAAVNNAKLFLAIQKEFGSFDTYIWSFTKGKTIASLCIGLYLYWFGRIQTSQSKHQFTFTQYRFRFQK